MNIIISHIILSIILFFIVNWIGKHSFSIGYMQISMFLKVEEAPAFNYVYRILSPTVYIIILSTLFYKFSLDPYVSNIYFVSIYYILFRLFFNIITNRALLINWTRLIITDVAIVCLAYLAYSEIIVTKQNLMPNFTTFSEELWIIIALFIYQVFNKVRLSSNSTIKRKDNYLRSRLSKFKNSYDELIQKNVGNKKLIALIYSIMIYEDFNRPKIIRIIENISHLFSNKPHTLGVMQVKTDIKISDEESVFLAIKKISTNYYQIPNLIKEKKKRRKEYYGDEYFGDDSGEIRQWEIEREILKNYNPDDDYIYEVSELILIVSKLMNIEKSEYTFEIKQQKHNKT